MKNDYTYFYRNPGQTNYSDWLEPKNIENLRYDLFCHILRGNQKWCKDRFISTTSNLDIASKNRTDRTGHENKVVLVIDLEKANEEIKENNYHDFSELTYESIEEKYPDLCKKWGKVHTKWVVDYTRRSSEITLESVKLSKKCYTPVPWSVIDFSRNYFKDDLLATDVALDFTREYVIDRNIKPENYKINKKDMAEFCLLYEKNLRTRDER